MSKEYRRLETSADLNRLMTRYYTVTGLIGRLKPLAWVTSGAPIEILEAMGIPSVYPENYGALCGARRIATALCEVAEGKGYSQDLCSYARTSLGSLYAPDKAPMGGLPKPALLICCNNICGNVVKWYESVAAFYKVPMFMLDVPYVHDPEPTPHAVDYVAGQMQDLIDWLGYHTRRKMHPDRLQKVVDYSNEAVSLWREIRELCTARPSPLNAPDLFTSMAPVVVMRGTRQAVDYYRKLRREVLGRVKRGEGAIPQERHRLLWDNIAVWPRIFRLFGEFARYGGCFVVDTYTNAWSLSISAGDLMTGLARTYTTVYINQSISTRADQLVDLARKFRVDGVVFHSNRSCKPYSFGQYDMRRAAVEKAGIPGLVLEADMCDTRAYSEAQLSTRIQAFMESLQAA